jgi:hypothetical protein
MQPAPETIARIERIVARRPVAWRRITRGYTVAARWNVRLHDGSTLFVKHATDATTADWLRAEARAYQALSGEFLPELIAFEDANDPILILEDLSAGFWPPPWSADHVERLMRLLDSLAAREAPRHFPSLAVDQAEFTGWRSIGENPSGFLGLGLVSNAWLRNALPALIHAEAGAVLAGDALVHGDVRSDNVCFHRDRAVLIDWNGAARGNPRFDLIAWLPSLHAEGGPTPWSLVKGEPELIAAIAGYFACRAWQPPPPQGVAIRQLQLAQLRAALPWVTLALDLERT